MKTEKLIIATFKIYLEEIIGRDSLFSFLEAIEEQTGRLGIKFYKSNLVYSIEEIYLDLYGNMANRTLLEEKMQSSVENNKIEIFYDQNN
jgi:hypothetical protein